jgi:hypothetical protein
MGRTSQAAPTLPPREDGFGLTMQTAERVADTFAPVTSVAVLLEASQGATGRQAPQSWWRTRASST